MDEGRAREISLQVFFEWADILAQQRATPALVLGISHGPKLGELHLCARDDELLGDRALEQLLERALDLMRLKRGAPMRYHLGPC